jgi:hypothetical protein
MPKKGAKKKKAAQAALRRSERLQTKVRGKNVVLVQDEGSEDSSEPAAEPIQLSSADDVDSQSDGEVGEGGRQQNVVSGLRRQIAELKQARAVEDLARRKAPQGPPSPPGILDRLKATMAGAGSAREVSIQEEEKEHASPGSAPATLLHVRLAPKLMKHVYDQDYRSMLDFVRRSDISNQRTYHEARRLAQSIDAFLKEGVTADFLGMEIAMRSLLGLVLADQTGNPALLEHLEWAPPKMPVSKDIYDSLVKTVHRAAKVKPRAAPNNPKGGQGGKK